MKAMEALGSLWGGRESVNRAQKLGHGRENFWKYSGLGSVSGKY